jgi:polyphosphate kinase
MFENMGEPLIYMGSADLMPRNLERRVELVFPVEDPILKTRLREMVNLMWRDNTCAGELAADGKYRRVEKMGEPVNSQAEFLR